MDKDTKQEFSKVHSELRSIGKQLKNVDERFEKIDERFEKIDQELAGIRDSMSTFETLAEHQTLEVKKVYDVAVRIEEKLTLLGSVKEIQDKHEVRISALEYAVSHPRTQ